MCLKSCFSGNTSEPSVLANGATRGEFWLAVHDFPAVLPTAYRDQDLERELGMAVSVRHPGASVTPHTLILSALCEQPYYLICVQATESQCLYPVTLPNRRFQLQRPSETPGPKLPVLQGRKQVCGTGQFIICPRPYCQRWE